jgi:hypothetical protein
MRNLDPLTVLLKDNIAMYGDTSLSSSAAPLGTLKLGLIRRSSMATLFYAPG